MIFYVEIFFMALILSTLFALWGIGFAIAFVPILSFFWLPFNEAKAIWLFLNSISTWTGAIRNWKKKVLDLKFAGILTIFSLLWAVVWSYLSKYVPVNIVKILFAVFLVFSIIMMLFWKKKEKINNKWNYWLIWIMWLSVWIVSWLLWVGGWAIFVPLLVLIWYDAKYVSRNMSFIIAISTFGWFLTYLSFVHIDWILLAITTVASIIWGWFGNFLMNEKMKSQQIKWVLAGLLVIIVTKLIWGLI